MLPISNPQLFAISLLSIENQVIYYSSWHVLATHILLSIPEFNTKDKIANHFKLPSHQIAVALEFLVRSGLAHEINGKYSILNTRTHLAKGSPLFPRHHTNWRIRAIQAMDHERENDLHYSGAFTLSKKDLLKVRSLMLSFIEESEPLIRQSKEETLCCINLRSLLRCNNSWAIPLLPSLTQWLARDSGHDREPCSPVFSESGHL